KQATSHIQATQGKNVDIKEYEALLRISGGDARKLLNALELVVNNDPSAEIEITNQKVQTVIQQNLSKYDKKGEMHYDIISAFIKSMRGSDPNAAVYWLARMIEGGEDPVFIARRILIFASEDIGNANPNALLLANACFDAVNKIGYPECRIVLSQAVVYMATSVKSNSTYKAIGNALEMVRRTGDLSVPLHIRNAPTKLMKDIGYGADYKYAHDYQGNFVDQEFLPNEIKGTKFYEPGDNPKERETRKFLVDRWKKYGY
ncbi:MAG: replication-associated recombination protein A, partial [Bacteroidales bacterium]|nr:replication-associated recombination protein A [Bacteroidales bacterium]